MEGGAAINKINSHAIMQRPRERSRHWSHRYLKRISSTEVTLKRETNMEIVGKIMTVPESTARREAVAAVVYAKHSEQTSVKRTPERILRTPGRVLTYVTPTQTAHVPMTPRMSLEEECGGQLRSRKRLFE
jgi:hypothetical protein